VDVTISVPAEMNVCDTLLDDNARQGRGDKVAVICGQRQATYRQLTELSARVASGLQALGLEPEQRVLLVLPDSIEFVAAYCGVMRLGAIAVPVNTLLKPQDYEYLLLDSRARALVVHADYLPNVPSTSPWLRHVIVVGGLAAAGPPAAPPAAAGHMAFDDLTASGNPAYPALMLSPDDAAFWLYSSGTTGFPKAVVHLQQDVLFSRQYGLGVLQAAEDCRMLSSSKLFFAYALGCALHIPLLAGGSTVLHSGRATPQAMAGLAAEHAPSFFFSVPTFYAASLHAGVPGEAYAAVRFCVSAGEALPPHIYQAWLDRSGKEIVEHIGSTEHIYAFISNRPGQVRPGSAGTPVPGIEARLVDEAWRDVAADQPGELWINSGSNGLGYWNKRQQTKATFHGEWLRTGDMMVRDADGCYWYQGRVNDMLKVGGIWVSPIEVEQALLEHAAVADAAVVGAPDQDGLIKPRAYVVCATGVSVEELQSFVKDRLAPYKYPRWIDFVDELPRTATGKVQRYQLRT